MPLKNESSPENFPFLGTFVVRIYIFNHIILNLIIYNLCYFLRKISSENSRLESTYEKSNVCSWLNIFESKIFQQILRVLPILLLKKRWATKHKQKWAASILNGLSQLGALVCICSLGSLRTAQVSRSEIPPSLDTSAIQSRSWKGKLRETRPWSTIWLWQSLTCRHQVRFRVKFANGPSVGWCLPMDITEPPSKPALFRPIFHQQRLDGTPQADDCWLEPQCPLHETSTQIHFQNQSFRTLKFYGSVLI